MKAPLDVAKLSKHWVHSREEDTSTETVYRPADYAFPPSRGRTGFVFEADGTMKRVGIGPADVSAVKAGKWRIVDPESGRIEVDVNNAREELTVQSLEEDRLVISKNK
jgi:hypothetical protein